MPLSDHEQRILEQMEQQLRSEDPRLASAIETGARRRPLTLALGSILVLGGLALLVSGVAFEAWPLSVGGFVVAFAGVLIAMRRTKTTPVGQAPAPAAPASSGVMGKLEERWERRRDGGD